MIADTRSNRQAEIDDKAEFLQVLLGLYSQLFKEYCVNKEKEYLQIAKVGAEGDRDFT